MPGRHEEANLKYQTTYVDETEPSSLGSDQATTPSSTLARQAAFPLILLRFISTKQPADLARGDTNVPSWNIGISSNVPAELSHKGDAKFADLIVGFAFGVKVRSSFAAADVH